MDHGIWATWYDLADDTRDEFLEWLHARYLPRLQARPGIAWVAHYRNEIGGAAMRELARDVIQRPDEDIGSGSQYVVLVGAASPHTFLNPLITAIDHDSEDREMLAKRIGVRSAVFSEETRVNGPAIGERPQGSTPGPAIQFGSFRVRSIEEEFDLGAWYAQYRLPHMARMSGSIATRKLNCVAGWVKHAILYEFTSLEARLQNFEEPHEALARDAKEWTGRVVRYTIHSPGSPIVGQRIWPEVE